MSAEPFSDKVLFQKTIFRQMGFQICWSKSKMCRENRISAIKIATLSIFS